MNFDEEAWHSEGTAIQFCTGNFSLLANYVFMNISLNTWAWSNWNMSALFNLGDLATKVWGRLTYSVGVMV